MPYVIQFMHPGFEHEPNLHYGIAWNPDGHGRKFVKIAGSYLPGLGQVAMDDDLLFWTEWEPQSNVFAILPQPVGAGLPHWIHEPFYTAPPGLNFNGLQNTDPYVFGHDFHYTYCKQRRHVALRNLTPGSLILFGSRLNNQFVLDTLFVVTDNPAPIHHNAGNYNAQLLPNVEETYADTVVRPIYGWNVVPDFTMTHYFGATHGAPFNHMFSFFPCLVYEQGAVGFARPVINLPGYVNPANSQAPNGLHNPNVPLQLIQQLWNSVVEQVLEQGLFLGVSAALPPLVPNVTGGDIGPNPVPQ